MTIIEQIKAEIDKLYGEYKDKFNQCGDQYHLGLIDGLDMAERVLDSIESEKPMNQSDYLDEELAIFLNRHFLNRVKYDDSIDGFTTFDASDLANHFYDLGCRRTAEKYDEIEYNRQRAEELEKPINPEEAMKELDEKIALVKQRGTWDGVDVDKYMDEVRGREPEKPMQEGLEEEIGSYMSNKWKFGCITPITPVVLPNFTTEGLKECARHFAEWQKEQMMKDAVEIEVWNYSSCTDLRALPLWGIDKFNNLEDGDKVRVIVLKKED